MVLEAAPDGDGGDRRDEPVSEEPLPQQLQCPALPSRRGSGARKRDEVSFFLRAKLRSRTGPWRVVKGPLRAPVRVPRPDALDRSAAHAEVGHDLRVRAPTVALQKDLGTLEHPGLVRPASRDTVEAMDLALRELDGMFLRSHGVGVEG